MGSKHSTAHYRARTKRMMTSLFDTYRVGAVHDEPLEQDPGDLLLNHLRLRLGEQIEQHAAEVVRVLVGVPELVRDSVEEEVSTLGVELVRQLFQFSARVPGVGWRGVGS